MATEGDFEQGALWALSLLQEQLRARDDVLRRTATGDREASQLLGDVRCLLESVRNRFEAAFVPLLREQVRTRASQAQKEER